MRRTLAAVLISLAFSSVASAANNGPWCYRDFGGPQYTNCSVYSARQCLAVAGTMGGACERNHKVAARPARKAKR